MDKQACEEHYDRVLRSLRESLHISQPEVLTACELAILQHLRAYEYLKITDGVANFDLYKYGSVPHCLLIDIYLADGAVRAKVSHIEPLSHKQATITALIKSNLYPQMSKEVRNDLFKLADSKEVYSSEQPNILFETNPRKALVFLFTPCMASTWGKFNAEFEGESFKRKNEYGKYEVPLLYTGHGTCCPKPGDYVLIYPDENPSLVTSTFRPELLRTSKGRRCLKIYLISKQTAENNFRPRTASY